ncbi:hypothetical protein J4E93_006366 [Alternaria ventricosa]|uniref:uncharacterized protein n=1 Tax=Alternaria ventricosa TaxID=1187951 RepID=UPI0020C41D38|nr:uncharacterized protein J4E93_006366 [Alternaria ventricosa]KAI4644463.1 hypothetical protein J4E93_006366 [Alternaria ventricosa]
MSISNIIFFDEIASRHDIMSDEPVELTNLAASKIDTPPEDATPPVQYPRGIRLALITVGLALSIFLAALDSTIIATAIPSITTQFRSISSLAWYGSSYAITNTAFQSAWGKAYQYFSLKATFMSAIAVFEIGNVICATAPTSEVLIFGRIVSGMGGGGVMTGAFIIVAMTAGPQYRAAYMGVFGVTFGSASVVGPLLGGVLTDGPGWRYCFWISLPIGFAAALTMFLCFHDPGKPKDVPLREKLLNLDLNGAILLSGCFSCFILATHWIGIMPPTSARIIGSFIGFVGLFICFAINERYMGSCAMVQARVFKNKLVFANLLYASFIAGAFFPLMYTLPIQFQAVNNNTASQSGVRLIPLVMGVSLFTMISNGTLTFWRHYKPFFLVGAILAVAGNIKIHSLDASTPTRDWVGFELLTATGVGLALQIPMIANQALVSADDLAAVTSMSLFMENTGTVFSVASSEAAFTNGLLSSLARNLPQLDAKEIMDAGATQIRGLFSGNELDQVLKGLNGPRPSTILFAVGVFAQVALLACIFWTYTSYGNPREPTALAETTTKTSPRPNGFTLRHLLDHGAGQPGPRARRFDVTPERFAVAGVDSRIGPFTIKTAPVKIERPALRGYDAQIPMSSMWIAEDIPGPDVTDKNTVISFANMSEDAYKVGPDDAGWMDVDGHYNSSVPFGWDDSGIRGHVFSDDTNSTIILAVKGTTVAMFEGDGTSVHDKENDNLYGSCCCGQGGTYLWRKVCDCQTGTYSCDEQCVKNELRKPNRYYAATVELYQEVTKIYPNAHIMTTGHSLGGVLASLIGLQHGIPAVTFEAYPQALAAKRLGLPAAGDVAPLRKNTGGFHFGHTADPVYMGTCNGATSFCSIGGYAFETLCHTGKKCAYDVVKDWGWRQNTQTHSLSTSTSTCQTPGWFGCKDKTTATVDVEEEKSASPRDVGKKFIAKDVERMEQTGYGRYLVSLRQNSALSINSPHEGEDVPFSKRRLTPIGIVSMQLARFPSEPSAPTIPDVGFTSLPRYFGNGYATEAAAGLMEYFTDEKGHKEFCGFCKPENTASANVLKRLGFEERGLREIDGVVKGEVLSALVWTIGVGHEKADATLFHEMSTPDGLATRRPEKRRRLERVAAACDLCKKRKVKCDGEQPCAYCTRKDRAATCTFSGPHARPQAHSAGHTPLHGVRSDDIHRHHPRSTGHTPNNRERDEQDDAVRQRLDREAAEDGTSLSPTLSRDDQQGDTVVPLEGRILRDAQGKSIFIGDCAPLSFLQTVRHLITSEVDPRATVQATRDPIIEIARPESAGQPSCPPIDVRQVDALVDEFMAASSGLVQLFQREDLAPELKAWASSRTSSSDDAAAAVFYLVLAIGAQERFEEKAEAWFNTARDVLLKHMCSSMNVSTVQGFALVAIYMLRASQPNGAYLYFSLAARAAYAIGIHRTEVNASFGETIKLVRDRIWKSIRVTDQLISNALGRPPSTSDVDCTVKYNTFEDTTETDDANILDASVQIFMIIERVVVEVYSRKRISLRIADYVSRQLKSWASKWLQKLSHLTTRPHSREAVVGACSTLCSYYYGIMLLTRPFLIYELYEYMGAPLKSGSSQADHQEKRKYADAALDAASTLVDTLLVVTITKQLPRKMPLIVSWLFTATLVLAVGILGDSGLMLVDSCKDAITCMDYFGQVDPHARQYSQVAQSLLKITTAHAKKRELHLRRKRKQASSELFGLLPGERTNIPPQVDECDAQLGHGSLVSRDSVQRNVSSAAPLDWTIYDADFFAMPWPSENDQGLQDFLQPGTHNLDGVSVADIPLFPIHDQQMGGDFFS